MNFTVIIPSKTASNLVPCLEAVRRHEPTVPVIIVDDGIEWKEVADLNPTLYALVMSKTSEQYLNIKVMEGIKPFIYARNCNLGIQACDGDVILLNDDAILETPFGFTELQQVSELHPEFGVISAVTNVIGNLAQQPKDVGLREERRTLAFVCVYIPRRTLERVGMLDEQYVSYGWEDNDFCRRVRNAGLKLGIFDDCFVDHGSLKSTFRGGATTPGDISAGREIYRKKWGDVA